MIKQDLVEGIGTSFPFHEFFWIGLWDIKYNHAICIYQVMVVRVESCVNVNRLENDIVNVGFQVAQKSSSVIVLHSY